MHFVEFVGTDQWRRRTVRDRKRGNDASFGWANALADRLSSGIAALGVGLDVHDTTGRFQLAGAAESQTRSPAGRTIADVGHADGNIVWRILVFSHHAGNSAGYVQSHSNGNLAHGKSQPGLEADGAVRAGAEEF
jgi:hypothetical protein